MPHLAGLHGCGPLTGAWSIPTEVEIHREKLWIPPYQVRGRLFKPGMTNCRENYALSVNEGLKSVLG
jgi:hypothetical protein